MSTKLFSAYTLGDFHSTLMCVMRETVIKVTQSAKG